MKLKIASGTIASIVVGLAACIGTAQAAPVQLVTNGGFETGNLNGWSSSSLGSSFCPSGPTDWNVSSSGTATNCVTVANPVGSTYAAYVMNDGPGPLTYRLFQTVTVSSLTTSGMLSFDLTDIAPINSGRTISVTLGGTTVFDQSSTDQQDPTSWKLVDVDVSAILAANLGKSLSLEFDNYIPGDFTGAGGLGLDNVSLVAQVSPTGVPEPASVALAAIALASLAATLRRKARR